MLGQKFSRSGKIGSSIDAYDLIAFVDENAL
jgi:hypothetical protein